MVILPMLVAGAPHGSRALRRDTVSVRLAREVSQTIMSTNILAGVILLLSLVAYQVISRQVQFRRMKRAWERGHAALRAGRLDEAEAAFRKCVRILPAWANGRSMLAAVLTQQQRLDDAEEQWKMAADLEPKRPGGHLALALFYACHVPGKGPEASAALAKAIECDPNLRSQLVSDPRLARLRGAAPPEQP